MKIDYIQMLRESAEFAWKYKRLWLFGFLLALTSGGNSLGGNSSFQTNLGDRKSDTGDKIANQFDNFEMTTAIWIIIAISIIVCLIFMMVFWYLGRVSKVALMKAVLLEDEGKDDQIEIKSLWKGSHQYLRKFMVFDLLFFVLALPVIAVLVLTIIPMFFSIPVGFITLCCLGIPVLIIAIIIMSVVKMIGERYMVLEDKGAWESIKLSWELIKKELKRIFIGWLVMLIPSFVIGAIIGVLSLILMLPVLGIIFAAFLSSNILAGIIIGGALGIIIGFFLKILEAPVKVFSETYWTKFLRMLIEDES